MAAQKGTIVDLSHVIRHGMVTLPGFPVPEIGTYLSREASRAHYAPGTEFHIATISMIANTGTYMDTPAHRYEGGADLASLPAEACFEVDGVVVHAGGVTAIGPEAFSGLDVRGRAVLAHTGWDRHFGTPEYGSGHPHLTRAAAQWLADGGAVLVGIDSLNVDDTADPSRPAHSILLAAGIPILEHLTNLGALPDRGFEVTALAPRIAGMGTFPVRAIARLID
ncbi:MAG: arylformamidase [Chloroflexota bacterium]|nr:arylformamidase [Chloroflexota bacterium]